MPWSDEEGKSWLATRVIQHRPMSLLDVGAGSGTYSLLLRDRLPGCVFIALEVHEPYVARFDLHARYDEVIVGDARTVPLPKVDVIVLGDVLEHMSMEDARALWARAREAATRAVFGSVPLGEHPQGAEEGNEFERHVASWTWEDVWHLPGVVAGRPGMVIGVVEGEPVSARAMST